MSSLSSRIIERFVGEFPKASQPALERLRAIIDEEGAKQLKERKRGEVVPDAEQVYALYPKKVGRDEALRAITHALKKNTLEYLLGKTNLFAEAVASWPVSYRYNQDGRDMCPNPATFYNQGRFADDPKEWKRFGARKAAPHQYVSPPEPPHWREAFPDFTEKEKPWNLLQPAQQAYIIANIPPP